MDHVSPRGREARRLDQAFNVNGRRCGGMNSSDLVILRAKGGRGGVQAAQQSAALGHGPCAHLPPEIGQMTMAAMTMVQEMRVTEKGGARQAKTVRDGMICRRGFIHTNRGVCSGWHPWHWRAAPGSSVPEGQNASRQAGRQQAGEARETGDRDKHPLLWLFPSQGCCGRRAAGCGLRVARAALGRLEGRSVPLHRHGHSLPPP